MDQKKFQPGVGFVHGKVMNVINILYHLMVFLFLMKLIPVEYVYLFLLIFIGEQELLQIGLMKLVQLEQ